MLNLPYSLKIFILWVFALFGLFITRSCVLERQARRAHHEQFQRDMNDMSKAIKDYKW